MIYRGDTPLDATLPGVNNADVDTLQAVLDSLPATATAQHQQLNLPCRAERALHLRGAIHSLGNDVIATCPLDFGSVMTDQTG
ncbi:hypothetical protein CEW81_21620 [Kluyvera genomosp. 3]|uniref:Uncharacterized protein n=1 Tax=Kluyvera genomosp. 3 TaxID=2774055 RepID=A0A248KKU4_9ENTR|nr:hypothetical protein CEW81_21620 [Kluyvera genomosp. 3]